MVVDVADVLRPAMRAGKRHLDTANDFGAVRRHLDTVIGIARRAVPFDARIWTNAARQGAILPLDGEHPRAFAEDEPVAAAIERARRGLRSVVVTGRDRAHA